VSDHVAGLLGRAPKKATHPERVRGDDQRFLGNVSSLGGGRSVILAWDR
jgi:hypothetical protein